MTASKQDVVRALDELATLTELDEGSPNAFRVRAYRNAKRAVESLQGDIGTLSEAELAAVRGIGKGIASRIRELIDSGRIVRLDELRSKHPVGQVELTRVPGLGPKSIQRLAADLGVTDVDALLVALDDGRVEALPGFGEATVHKLRAGIEALGLHSKQRRIPIAYALPIAEQVVDRLREVDGIVEVAYAGSLRRFCETVGDIDILVASRGRHDLLEVLREVLEIDRVLGAGTTKTSVVTRTGVQVDVRVVKPDVFGAAMVYFTGSKAHNIRLRQRAQQAGMTLNEYGLRRLNETGKAERSSAFPTEEGVYDALAMAWVPPELREDAGEIEQALSGQRFELIDQAAIVGDLHCHTDVSGDGRVSLDDLVEAAAERGLRYMAITDHAERLTINGVGRDAFVTQRQLLRGLEEQRGDIALLHGAELNIAADGGLDFDRTFLATFDWLVASVHSDFGLPPDRQTERIAAAMRHPAVTAIGHLSGRMIGSRPGIELDVDRILDVAVETGVALEINSSLQRLDPAADVIAEGARRGVRFVISTDAHSIEDLDRMRHGVSQARRAGLAASSVLNTQRWEQFSSWLQSIR